MGEASKRGRTGSVVAEDRRWPAVHAARPWAAAGHTGSSGNRFHVPPAALRRAVDGPQRSAPDFPHTMPGHEPVRNPLHGRREAESKGADARPQVSAGRNGPRNGLAPRRPGGQVRRMGGNGRFGRRLPRSERETRRSDRCGVRLSRGGDRGEPEVGLARRGRDGSGRRTRCARGQVGRALPRDARGVASPSCRVGAAGGADRGADVHRLGAGPCRARHRQRCGGSGPGRGRPRCAAACAAPDLGGPPGDLRHRRRGRAVRRPPCRQVRDARSNGGGALRAGATPTRCVEGEGR